MGAEDHRAPSPAREAGGAEGGDATAADEAHRRLLLSFTAFDASHHRLWLRYAHVQVGSPGAAQRVVEDACRHLLDHWEHALRQKSLTRYAWTVLKEYVARWLSERGQRPQLAETAAFHAAIRKVLLFELRDEFAVLEGEIGLYAAIARLPERQYDTVVLRYVLGCTEEEVAGYLGSDAATVRSHIRYAKRKLARELLKASGPGPEAGG